MKKFLNDAPILYEEKRTLKWFLALFYLISISFDLFYKYFFPKFIKHSAANSPGVVFYFSYVVLFGLLLVVYFFNRQEKQYLIKYVYFITFTLLSLYSDFYTYIGNPGDYKSGNAVEIFWLLLSPIFVSSRFFWVVSLGLILRYILVGFILPSPIVIFPILMIAVLSIFSYILLNRFQSYVNAVKVSYDKQLEGIVKGVIAALELKDPYTRGHSERVASYALSLAKKIERFTEEELKSFNYACLLHDIGKVNIPDQILMKPGSLTLEEYEIIKSHTVVGAEAVSKVNGMKNSLDVIRSHHERWDGKGYPDQLIGREIPFLARVTAIADAFDAMTSSRSYRTALSVEEAYKRVIEGSGSQFDPYLVEEFKKVFPVWLEIHEDWLSKTNKQHVNFRNINSI